MNKSDKARIKSIKKSKASNNAERDTVVGSKNFIKNIYFFGPEAKRWYILIGLSVIISILLFPNILIHPKVYRPGDIADRDIKATREFLVENVELTEKNRLEAVKAVLSVYDFDPTATGVVERIKEAFKVGRNNINASVPAEFTGEGQGTSIDSFKNHFFEILDVPSEDNIVNIFAKSGFPSEVEEVATSLVTHIFNNGVVSNKMMLMSQSGKGIIIHDINTGEEIKAADLNRFYDLKSARNSIIEQGKTLSISATSPELTNASVRLAATLIKPNLTFNKRETERRKNIAWKSVKPFYFKVKNGEMLVREGERVKPENILKLSEQFKLLKQNEMIGQAPAMAVLVGFLLLAMYFVGLVNDRSYRREVKNILFTSFILLTIFLVVMASNFVAEETSRGFNFFSSRALLFAIPVASGAMLVSIFQGMSVAISFSLVISILASLVVGGRVEFFIYFFITSLMAANGVKDCPERGVFIGTGLKVSAIGVVLALSIEALYGFLYTLEAVLACASAIIGGILVGVVTTGILPLIEMAFGYTTNIKLLELANLDQPLLRELMVQAPGTYHHSVIVSNMVEATAKAVNANPVLAKVAAYYHDIGKMKKPLYFVENQLGRENRHEKLAPSMSSLILISHIKDGVELAAKNKLGREIIDIISQHHGTSLITFFYEKARDQSERKGGKSIQVKEEDFRYPGPKPQTKEAGLVMLADAVEAASKTLVDPTSARIQGMVQKIINKVFSDGQLDECELTLKDLHKIAKGFNKTLSGIFHHRVEYPEPVVKTAHSKRVVNGNTDQVSAGNSQANRPEDKAEAGENLKRLGLS
ncbi:MAG TPA: HD family phosphohydrolase [Desulfobacteraceae bacterium]|nr:HD family phosphohydrolase [Desulfobacteraceae bacterium]